MGTDREYRLEDVWNRGKRQYYDLARSADGPAPDIISSPGPHSAPAPDRSRDTYAHELVGERLAREQREWTAHESTHDQR